PVELPAAFGLVGRDRVAGAVADGLEAAGGDAGEVLQHVVLHRQRAALRQRHVAGRAARRVGVALDAQVGVAERRHRLAQRIEHEEGARHDLVAARREVDLDLLVDDGAVGLRRRLGGELRLLYLLPRVVAGERLQEAGVGPVLGLDRPRHQPLLAPDDEGGVEQGLVVRLAAGGACFIISMPSSQPWTKSRTVPGALSMRSCRATRVSAMMLVAAVVETRTCASSPRASTAAERSGSQVTAASTWRALNMAAAAGASWVKMIPFSTSARSAGA